MNKCPNCWDGMINTSNMEMIECGMCNGTGVNQINIAEGKMNKGGLNTVATPRPNVNPVGSRLQRDGDQMKDRTIVITLNEYDIRRAFREAVKKAKDLCNELHDYDPMNVSIIHVSTTYHWRDGYSDEYQFIFKEA